MVCNENHRGAIFDGLGEFAQLFDGLFEFRNISHNAMKQRSTAHFGNTDGNLGREFGAIGPLVLPFARIAALCHNLPHDFDEAFARIPAIRLLDRRQSAGILFQQTLFVLKAEHGHCGLIAIQAVSIDIRGDNGIA